MAAGELFYFHAIYHCGFFFFLIFNYLITNYLQFKVHRSWIFGLFFNLILITLRSQYKYSTHPPFKITIVFLDGLRNKKRQSCIAQDYLKNKKRP